MCVCVWGGERENELPSEPTCRSLSLSLSLSRTSTPSTEDTVGQTENERVCPTRAEGDGAFGCVLCVIFSS